MNDMDIDTAAPSDVSPRTGGAVEPAWAAWRKRAVAQGLARAMETRATTRHLMYYNELRTLDGIEARDLVLAREAIVKRAAQPGEKPATCARLVVVHAPVLPRKANNTANALERRAIRRAKAGETPLKSRLNILTPAMPTHSYSRVCVFLSYSRPIVLGGSVSKE